MIRVVIDTNVLVSAMIASHGNEAVVVIAVSQGFLTPLLSREIVTEYREVLLRPKFSFADAEVTALLELLDRNGQFVRNSSIGRVSPDPDDDKFIACARAGKAEFLVTGNKRHFPEGQLPGVRIVSAGELIHAFSGTLRGRFRKIP